MIAALELDGDELDSKSGLTMSSLHSLDPPTSPARERAILMIFYPSELGDLWTKSRLHPSER